MSYQYTVDLGTKTIDLDDILSTFTGGSCTDNGAVLRRELQYLFGAAGVKFIVDTLQEKIDNIKAENNSPDSPDVPGENEQQLKDARGLYLTGHGFFCYNILTMKKDQLKGAVDVFSL